MQTLIDFINHFVLLPWPLWILLVIVVGAGLLWRRTRRAPDLAQFVASCLFLAAVAFDYVHPRIITPESSALERALQSDAVRITVSFTEFLGFSVFSASYLWHALTHKRI